MQDNIFLPINNFDNFDWFKIIPFEIEYAYEHSAPYWNDGQSWMPSNFNGTTVYFKSRTWESIELYWKEEYYNDSLERITYENFSPYYEAYHKGFMKAYSEYEEITKKSVSLFGNTETFANKVFDDAMKSVNGIGHALKYIDEKRVKVLQIQDWYKCGELAGKNYKAWYLIVNNYREFIPIFRTSEIMINFYKTALRCTEDIEFNAGIRERLVKIISEIAPTPARKAEEQGNKKAGRPIKDVCMIDKTLYLRYTELTLTNRITISKTEAIKELANEYKNTYNPDNMDSTKASIRRVIKTMSEQ